MTLSFGLNIKPNSTETRPAPPSKKPKGSTVFDASGSSSDDDDDAQSASRPEAITTFSLSTKPSSSSSNTTSQPRKAGGTTGPSRRSKEAALRLTAPGHAGSAAPEDFGDLTSTRASTLQMRSAETVDPSLYDYDGFLTRKTAVEARAQAAKKADAVERKAKYVDALVAAAERRKVDQMVARDKALQREREAEGPETGETFVTEAYKRQREEAKRVEELEERKREEEERRRAGLLGGGRSRFLAGVLGEQERGFEEKRREVEEGVVDGWEGNVGAGEARDEVEEARRRGVDVLVNDDGEVADKRQLLSAGLNVGTGGKGAKSAEHLRSDRAKARESAFAGRAPGDVKGQRERQTRMMEEQLAASNKRKADEEAEERRKLEHAAKSTKTAEEVQSAKEKALQRRKEREAAKKSG